MDVGQAVAVTRFWSNVDRSDADGCWPWTGYTEKGYGRFHFGGRMRFAHELALTFTTGEVRGEGLDTCHRCDNPPCCNPAHLRFGTRSSNVRDAIRSGTHHHPSRRLTEEQIVEMRERAAAGAPLVRLAEAYEVSPSAVSMIVTGRKWPEAGGPIRPPREGAYKRKVAS